MAKRGRPKLAKRDKQAERIDLRVNPLEKRGFEDAAGLSGLGLSAWMRTRLREAARAELMAHGKPAPFIRLKGDH